MPNVAYEAGVQPQAAGGVLPSEGTSRPVAGSLREFNPTQQPPEVFIGQIFPRPRGRPGTVGPSGPPGPQGVQGPVGPAASTTDLVTLAPNASTRNVVQPTAASITAFVVKGAASQSANLTEFHDSAGTLLALVAPDGQIRSQKQITAGSLTLPPNTSGKLNAAADADALVLMVRGVSGQTADLAQFQNSAGSAVAFITASGFFRSQVSRTVGAGTQQAHIFGSGNTTMDAAGTTDYRELTVSPIAAGANAYSTLMGLRVDPLHNASGVGTTVTGAYITPRVTSSAGATATTLRGLHVQTMNQSTTLTVGTAQTILVDSPTVGAGGTITTKRGIQINRQKQTGVTTAHAIYVVGDESFMQAGAVAEVPLTLRGVASQTGNLQQWQNSAGTNLAHVASDGATRLARLGINTNPAASTALWVSAVSASAPASVVRALPSQTGDFEQWQADGGAVMASVLADGTLRVNNAGRGLRLTSPDGLTTRTLTIDNSGALVVAA